MQIVEATPKARDIVQQLNTPTRLKTWSVIVTFFGDVVVPRGGSISAVSLGQVMETMGIGAGAVRTAISRLAADGWIERSRNGRISFYRLTRSHERAFQQATKRIYARSSEQTHKPKWALVYPSGEVPNALDPSLPSVVSLPRNWYCVDLEVMAGQVPEDAMVFEGEFKQNPDWFTQLLAPPEQADAMRRLMENFQDTAQVLRSGTLLDPLEALAIRCLLIHEWRRIVLKLNSLHPELVPADWPEAECRSLVRELYQRLLEPSEQWLTQNATCDTGRLPPAKVNIQDRFQ